MKRRIFWIWVASVCGALVYLTACNHTTHQERSALPSAKPQIIFDTDFGGDADDLGALAMLHFYADQDSIDLKAVTSWSHETFALPALVAVNTYYGRPDLPLGGRDVPVWRTEWNHTKILADRFPYDPEIAANTQDAVTLYRTLLAQADAHAITIVTVGPLANISNLLQSPGDDISHLSGAELVDQKVDKFVIMGGQFPDGITAHGAEWNFDGNMPGITQYVLDTVQRPIIFSGYEVGEALKVGTELNTHPMDTPLYVGYKYFSEHAPWINQNYAGEILDNSSFDQTAVIFAAIGGVDRFWTLSEPGIFTTDAKGVGSWQYSSKGRHRYILLNDDTEDLKDYIATLMMHK